jgi:hypothetical protein
MGVSDSWNPQGLSSPVQELLYLYLTMSEVFSLIILMYVPCILLIFYLFTFFGTFSH